MEVDAGNLRAPSESSKQYVGANPSTHSRTTVFLSSRGLAIAMLVALGALSTLPFIKRTQEAPDKRIIPLMDLRRSNGVASPQLQLAILGQVFDVSKGKKYYGEGGSYHFFVGKDASRAYSTGDFEHDLNDVVEDLQPDQLASIVGWRSFYAKGYPLVGKLAGSFYAVDGSATELLRWVEGQAASAPPKEAQQRQADGVPCTVQWAQGEGTVSCAHGQHPRRVDAASTAKGSCLCYSSSLFSSQRQLFPDCQPDASQCMVTSM